MPRRTVGLLAGILAIIGLVHLTMLFFTSTGLPGGNYRMWRGAVEGNAATIRGLAVRPRDLNAPDVRGWTPLLLAAGMGHQAAVQALLVRGADVNLQDEDGRTALMWATAGGYADVVRTLLDKGAVASIRDRDGNTALHLAAYGALDPSNAGLWSKMGPVNSAQMEPPRGQYAQVAAELLAHGAGVHSRNAAGETPLMVAAKMKNRPVALLLSQSGDDR
jgi:ankyrin repeat protein